jgi:hypothetical protein
MSTLFDMNSENVIILKKNVIDNDNDNKLEENEYIKKKYKGRKQSKDSVEIPPFSSHNTFLTKTFTVNQLKEICKFYKLKVVGNKQVLINKIYHFLYFSSYIVIIQRAWRKKLYKTYSELRGPAKFNRKICVNETDFSSMEPLIDIPFEQFFSYVDNDGKIYGFDIVSLYNLLNNKDLKDSNPYNRNSIPNKIKMDFKRLLNISKIMGLDLDMNLVVEDITDPVKRIEMNTLNTFREIDNLGNYTNPNWFIQLNQRQVVKFLQELRDIWIYRAHLDNNTMMEICPPNGNPFDILDMSMIINIPLYNIKLLALLVMNQFIKNGVDRESRILGANYVLCALTLVSTDAADALPWLYQSVANFL